MSQCDFCHQSYHESCASTLNEGKCACVYLDLDLGCAWDSYLSSRIGELTANVPEQLWCRAGPRSTSSLVTMETFFEAYPCLRAENSIQDGHSCQFIAVGLAACGSPLIAQKLRILAVRELCRQWNEIGEVVKSEISDQSGEDVGSLDQARCCKLMLGSPTARPLWGNECTMTVLPSVVKKNITVLTIANGRPFKHVYRYGDCKDTVYIGFIPEFHFFALRVASTPCELTKSCDESVSVPKLNHDQHLTSVNKSPALASPKRHLESVVRLHTIQCSFGEYCQFSKQTDAQREAESFRHCPVCDGFFHESCVPYSDIGCPCIFAIDVRDPKGDFMNFLKQAVLLTNICYKQ